MPMMRICPEVQLLMRPQRSPDNVTLVTLLRHDICSLRGMYKKAKCFLLSLAILAQSFLFVHAAGFSVTTNHNGSGKFAKVQEYNATIQVSDIEETDSSEIDGDQDFLYSVLFEYQGDHFASAVHSYAIHRTAPLIAVRLNVKHCTFLI